jgi:hypothetical protein
MLLPLPTKISAFAEDPENPVLSLYSETPDVLAKIFAARSQLTTKKENTMSIAPEYYTEPRPVVSHVPGIHASADRGRLVRTLSSLGLIPFAEVGKLEALAAHNMELGVTVSVYELDRKLRTTDAKLEDRIGFKRSLERANILTL